MRVKTYGTRLRIKTGIRAGMSDGGGGDPPPDPTPPVDDPPKDDSAAKALAAAEARAKALEATVAKQADADKKAKAAETRRKAEADGKTKELLDETSAKLDRLEERNKALEASMLVRAESKLAALDESTQERLNRYKDKVELDVWIDLVEDASANAQSAKDGGGGTAPPAAGGSLTGKGKETGFKPLQQTVDFLEGADKEGAVDHLRSLSVKRDPENPASRIFTKPVKNFIKDMNQTKSVRMTRPEADERLRKG